MAALGGNCRVNIPKRRVYDPDTEQKAHFDLHGQRTKSYYTLNIVYPLLILSSTANHLPQKVETAMLTWVWDHRGGMGYIFHQQISQFPQPTERRFVYWLEAIEVLSRFKRWKGLQDARNYLVSLQGADGFWEYNIAPGTCPYFPLSESWLCYQNYLNENAPFGAFFILFSFYFGSYFFGCRLFFFLYNDLILIIDIDQNGITILEFACQYFVG
jgi:hypothetical protein